MEVDFTVEDCGMLETWFEALFAKKNNSTKKERFLYSKILVIHDAILREEQKMKDMLTKD